MNGYPTGLARVKDAGYATLVRSAAAAIREELEVAGHEAHGRASARTTDRLRSQARRSEPRIAPAAAAAAMICSCIAAKLAGAASEGFIDGDGI